MTFTAVITKQSVTKPKPWGNRKQVIANFRKRLVEMGLDPDCINSLEDHTQEYVRE